MEEKLEKLKGWAMKAWDKSTDLMVAIVVWCVRNWQIAVVLMSSLTALLKHVLKLKKARDEKEYRNRRFYDRRTDRWHYANRHINKRQERIIEERYLDGESYRSILDSMGLL